MVEHRYDTGERNRRQFLLGAVTLAGVVTLAGCNGSDDELADDDDVDDPEGRVDEFLGGNNAKLYDGSVEDLTGQEEVTMEVGAGEDGLAYDPPAARIDQGTAVVWEWTGRGGRHNVVSSDRDDSDFEFSSGDLVEEAGHTWSYEFEEAGVCLYYCEAHRAQGHLGGLIVE